VTAVNALIVFYSSGGEAERFALAAGVGAIQARASIRLRRLPVAADFQPATLTPQQRQNFDRMARDYVAPRPADSSWADVIILGMPSEGASELQAYVEGLPSLNPTQPAPAVAPLPATLDSIVGALALGRDAVAAARARKSGD
jgi:hypothetical protein